MSNIINMKEMYNFYKQDYTEEITRLQKEKSKIKQEINIIVKDLTRKKYFINKYTTLQFTGLHDLLTFDITTFKATTTFKMVNLKEIKEKVDRIQNLNVSVEIIDELIEKQHEKIVNQQIYTYIIKEFNKRIIEDIVKGYKFNMCGNGVLKIIVRKNNRKSYIDWAASNKNKEVILANGEIPYKEEEDEFGNITDNGGIKWLVNRYDAHNCWIQWYKQAKELEKFKELPLYEYYTIKFTMSEKGIIKKLNQRLKDKPYTKRFY